MTSATYRLGYAAGYKKGMRGETRAKQHKVTVKRKTTAGRGYLRVKGYTKSDGTRVHGYTRHV